MAKCRKCGRTMKLYSKSEISTIHRQMRPGTSGHLRHGGHPLLATFATVVNIGSRVANHFFELEEYYCSYCDSDGMRVGLK